MKMLKKLLAIVLTGAMALTLLTACGSNAVTEKGIVDAMNEMVKAIEVNVTFTPRPKERELARKIAELIEKESATATAADGKDSSNNAAEEELKRILGIDKGGANEENFVWTGTVVIDELGVSGQAFDLQKQVLDVNDAHNGASLGDKKPADTRYVGSALCKVVEKGKQVTVRVIVVTAEAK
jgi:hypothetical protein